ncbi:SusC/RagA family TonB-linked outer membrane protein [Flexithrix dorotheae]|uniref:SusC/RagA family TonB-linked outer membrane protein n=1 Tax=Flexithrix dorotheae TaxID=70993 RepID=UPI000693560D|nr:TonB-dependent receptor [Flexithrix dorotheae]
MKKSLPITKLLLCGIWLLLLSANALVSYGQENTVSGTVISPEDNEPLPGVSILIKGTSTGTTTDFDGNYKLQASPESILQFSYIGYKTYEVTVGTQSEINVALEPDLEQLEEVVVIGYGTQKKSDMTGAVGSVDSEELSKFTAADATQALQGRMAGVRVENNGGAPGANPIVTIRGSGTLSDSGPLYVIDGMLTGSMSMLNPSDIESVTVLKDASASAIYGSRAANGVIIVTTKKGSKSGRIAVDLDVNYGVQEAIKTIDWANARQYADIVNRARDNDGNPRFPANDTEFDPTVDSDIQAASLQTAPIFSADVRVSGGGENSSFSVSANHLDQEGILKNSEYSRTNLRANSSFTKGRFTLQETIGLSRTVNNPNNYFNKERDLIPTIPIYDEDGNFTASNIPEGNNSSLGGYYGPGNIGNSLGLATLEDRTVTRNSLLGNIDASFEIIDGLVYKLNLGIETYSENNYTFTPEYFFNSSPVGNTTYAELSERNTNFMSTLIENTLSYNKIMGKHSIGLLGGFTEQKSNRRYLGVVARRFPSNDIRVASAAEERAQMPSADLTSAIQSYFGRVNYTFNDKYLLTATIRRDGSSLFREELRWGTFPSVAVGWNLSNESFMDNVTAISNLKLRASYGEIGSNNVPVYSISPEMNLYSQYPIGVSQERATGYSITKGVNSNITWETTKTTDIGLEFRALNGKLDFTMDYFIKNSEDVLVELGLPLYTGFGNRVPFNTASIENKGWEFLVGYNEAFGEFQLGVTSNFTFINNTVTALGDATPIIEGQFTSNGLKGTKTDIGEPISSFYGYVVEGIYQTDAEAEASNSANNPQAGDIRFKDIDGDGDIDSDDQTFLGNPTPNFEYGFNINGQYKGFDFTMFFNGVSGNKILNANKYRGYFDTEGNYLADALNGWSPENPNTDIPRNTLSDPGFNRRMSDFYLENGSYFRLRNLQIGYTLPSELTSKWSITRARFYGTIQNVFTITNYTGYYPEVGRNTRGSRRIFSSGVDESAYPAARTFQLGVQLGF